ncbi:MAG: glycosyltransferase family 4 protein [Bryobacteraceae bacterium]
MDTGREMRGGQWQVLHLIQGLRERGVACDLLARGPLLDAARKAGFAAEEASWTRAIRASAAASLVHAHDARAHSWGAMFCPEKLVVSRRVMFPIGTGVASRWKYRRALAYVAISESVRQRLIAAGVDAAKVHLVFDGLPPLAGARGDGSKIVAPASDDPAKGTDLARETGLDIVFSRDLAADLPGAAVFLYLSREEGLGSAVLLAMSAGIPVVASRVGGLPELIDHGRTGLLVGNEPAAIREAVEKLLADRTYAQLLGEAGRHKYQSGFTVDRMVEGTLEVYRECLRKQ